ncbi:hypothetical protein FJ365_04270, partial [Candidatus Dependentiae bacterium]|nr:hypothetical protein [Candidatus Dependentiae bacterium]
MKHLHRFFVTLSIILVSTTSAAFTINIGKARIAWHDGGIKVTRKEKSHTCTSNYCASGFGNLYIFSKETTGGFVITGLIASLLRGALVPLEHR